MVIQCTFSSPRAKKEELTKCFRRLPPLSPHIVGKGVLEKEMDDRGRVSITIVYEFEEAKRMEVSREIFGQIDAFSGIPRFEFSTQVCAGPHPGLAGADGVAGKNPKENMDGGLMGHRP